MNNNDGKYHSLPYSHLASYQGTWKLYRIPPNPTPQSFHHHSRGGHVTGFVYSEQAGTVEEGRSCRRHGNYIHGIAFIACRSCFENKTANKHQEKAHWVTRSCRDHNYKASPGKLGHIITAYGLMIYKGEGKSSTNTEVFMRNNWNFSFSWGWGVLRGCCLMWRGTVWWNGSWVTALP